LARPTHSAHDPRSQRLHADRGEPAQPSGSPTAGRGTMPAPMATGAPMRSARGRRRDVVGGDFRDGRDGERDQPTGSPSQSKPRAGST
jgi:hypothetical protein